MNLKSTINQLKQKLHNFEDMMTKAKKPVESTFKCENCDKQYTQKSNWLIHMIENNKCVKVVPIKSVKPVKTFDCGCVEAHVETPTREHKQQETQVSVDNLQSQEEDRDKTWQLAGGSRRPKCSI